jgi:DNA-binding Lrp family transcriptional regulator
MRPPVASLPVVDATDRKILAHLQADGRLSITELAARLPLSVSRCQRRLRALEASGAVRGYRADVDPEHVGLGFSALVFATLRQEDRDTVRRFEEGVQALAEVVAAQRLFGEPDYLLRVVTADLVAYRRLYDEGLATLPGVQKLTSTLVMAEVVADRGLPLGSAAR